LALAHFLTGRSAPEEGELNHNGREQD
jgi:hypothetical protein